MSGTDTITRKVSTSTPEVGPQTAIRIRLATLVTIIAATAGAVVWGTTMQLGQAELSRRMDSLAVDVQEIRKAVVR